MIVDGLGIYCDRMRLKMPSFDEVTKDNYTFEAKAMLTRFLEDEGVIPEKSVIRSNYDRVIPDDWEKLKRVTGELIDNSDKEEIERLTVPILPRMYYKAVHRGKINRIVVEADGENKEFRLLIFLLKDCYFLYKEIRFRTESENNLGINERMNWFDYYADLYGAWGKENPEFMKRTEEKRSYYDFIYDLTDTLQNQSEKCQEDEKKEILEYVHECMDLIVYMNYCIDIEIFKRKQAEKDLLNDPVNEELVDKEKVTKKVIYQKNRVRNAREIHIGDICINLGKSSGTKKSGVLHRKCMCWGVRGHNRYYKNGKVVYIKPYKKGRDRSKVKPDGKTYVLKSG